ncbi:lymphocyte antigen 6 complex locus protein G6c isoform X2 [Lutra lutra]|uniref:lymphocyte antigen 6 complex locus protein G6c isoform X2 n=1 Tax=Lutra lutra TaxID=9657 RepID=UPI001FD5AC40|nr:lymphocyte antigen 6 complex locus protein G6c isoform X2 [Lutra lutra]
MKLAPSVLSFCSRAPTNAPQGPKLGNESAALATIPGDPHHERLSAAHPVCSALLGLSSAGPQVPVLGCVDRQSCRLEPGQQCLTTNVYLGKMWVFSNLRCGTPEEPCRETFNQTNHKLGLTYNTTCCNKDNCNSPAPRPTPALALVLLTSVAGLGLWLLH